MSDDGPITADNAADRIDAIEEGSLIESLNGHRVTIAFAPRPHDELYVVTAADGDVLRKGERTERILHDRTERGAFLNQLERDVEKVSGIDAEDTRDEAETMVAEVWDIWQEEETEVLTDQARTVIDAIEYPVHVYRGENTTWNISVKRNGRIGDIELSTNELRSPMAFENQWMGEFVEKIRIEQEDWDSITDRFMDHVEEYDVGLDENDAVVERMVASMSRGAKCVTDRDKLGNEKRAVWLDTENATDYEHAGEGQAVAWVQAEYFNEALDRAGKEGATYNREAAKTLKQRDMTFGPAKQARWAGTRSRFYPFDPDALDLDNRPVDDGEDTDATSEVDI